MNHQRTSRKLGISLPEKPERQGASHWHPHNTPCRSALPSQRFFTKHEIAPKRFGDRGVNTAQREACL